MLTERQLMTLQFIDARIRATGGVSPSFQEIAEHISPRLSKSKVGWLLDRLEERGFVRRRRHCSRSIEVLRMPGSPDDLGEVEEALADYCREIGASRGAVIREAVAAYLGLGEHDSDEERQSEAGCGDGNP